VHNFVALVFFGVRCWSGLGASPVWFGPVRSPPGRLYVGYWCDVWSWFDVVRHRFHIVSWLCFYNMWNRHVWFWFQIRLWFIVMGHWFNVWCWFFIMRLRFYIGRFVVRRWFHIRRFHIGHWFS
jgi:hypothetical protein